MRFRTLEIRWHDGKPISSCDFQPVSFKKIRHPSTSQTNYATQSYRLATAGEDNLVRIWLVHPNMSPSSLNQGTQTPAPRPARAEYLSTLSRHSAAVNVVRFSPSGEHIASAGDDGMIIIWSQSVTPQAPSYGSEAEESQYDKEHWKPRIAFRCTTMQVYDLAWSPTGEYLIAGSTDNVARIFSTVDGKCVYEIAEHSHYVQGVAWDPLNEYIATQSSDRSMHIYRISHQGGSFEVHGVGKNTRIPHRHSRTPSVHGRSTSRPRNLRRESITSDAESAISDHPRDREDSSSKDIPAPPTPMSTPSSSMFPPPMERSSSRRSSFSGSNAPGSPSTFSRYGRSPSPMPALPAIRTPPASSNWTSTKLYGDESFTNFFRRLTFSPDGALLLTPAGQFEDPSITPASKSEDSTKPRGRPANVTGSGQPSHGSSSCVYIYSRANFARPPIGQLPGHQKPSVAVRYSPLLYELRQGVSGPSLEDTKAAVVSPEAEGTLDIDMMGPRSSSVTDDPASSLISPHPTPALRPVHSRSQSQQSQVSPIAAPSPLHPQSLPISSSTEGVDATISKPATPSIGDTPTSSMFALPYRMLYAVLTMDAVAIYDTQQSSPLCLLTKLHYDEFTDATWSPDGQCLMLSSRDGYCTLVIFDDIIPTYHTQQHALQMQSIAHNHSVPITVTHGVGSSSGNNVTATPPANSKKRSEPPLTPAASVDGDRESASSTFSFPPHSTVPDTESDANQQIVEPPKKKRRVALTRIGDLDS